MSSAFIILGSIAGAICLTLGWLWLYTLRRLKDDQKHYFNDSPDLLCIANFEGYFTKVNGAFLRILGYTEKELYGQPFLSLVHELDQEATIRASRQLSDGEGVSEFENRLRCKNGSWKWLLWNSRSDIVRRRIFAHAKDITKRKILEDELRLSQVALTKSLAEERALLKALQEKADSLLKSNLELASFAHVVAHDLQEPLRTITSYTAILEGNNIGNFLPEDKETMAFIVDAARRMKELIRDLLIYGRVDNHDLKLSTVSLIDVMHEVVSNLKVAIDESQATILFETLPCVHADRRYMIQLFQNLVGNALKYRGENAPMIRLTAMTDGIVIKISVQDNGIGIAPRHHQRIFGMFKRLHTREKYEGTGIGLALCKKIAEVSGGTIWVESELGNGATFFVTLQPVPTDHLHTKN